jgi:hypothetical protein
MRYAVVIEKKKPAGEGGLFRVDKEEAAYLQPAAAHST